MQNNTDEAPRKRGRPRLEQGQHKQSSIRIRPALQARLAESAERTGQSIAAEVEHRLARSFDDVYVREPTRQLLRRIATVINEVEDAGRRTDDKAETWNTTLRGWAIVRELLANGPITEFAPHPTPETEKAITEANDRLRAMLAERSALTRGISIQGVTTTGPEDAILGSAWLGAAGIVNRNEAREAIEDRTDIPADIKAVLLSQVDRLEQLDREIDEVRTKLKKTLAPYLEARKAARRFIYGTQGIQSLPLWLTTPVALDEPPTRGMFAPS